MEQFSGSNTMAPVSRAGVTKSTANGSAVQDTNACSSTRNTGSTGFSGTLFSLFPRRDSKLSNGIERDSRAIQTGDAGVHGYQNPVGHGQGLSLDGNNLPFHALPVHFPGTENQKPGERIRLAVGGWRVNGGLGVAGTIIPSQSTNRGTTSTRSDPVQSEDDGIDSMEKTGLQRDRLRALLRGTKSFSMASANSNIRNADFLARFVRSLDANRKIPGSAAVRHADGVQHIVNSNGVIGNFVNNILKPVEVPRVNQPLNHRNWSNEIGNRVMFVSKQNLKSAVIRINPAQLGPIEVKVSLQNDQATVSFCASHASVREALEAAIPRLKEMFTDNGYQSVDVDVAAHQDSNGQASDSREQASGFHAFGEPLMEQAGQDDPATDKNRESRNVTLGIVDYYV